jgi:imidazolonepropionase-like amidohydrolase
VRDLSDLSLALRAAADESDPTLTTIVAAGPPLTTPRGHCYFLGGITRGADGIRATVRAHADQGVDLIKIMASGGTLTSGIRVDLPQFGGGKLRIAVREAHRHGLPLVAHAHGGQAVAAAVTAGVDGIEHVSFFTPTASNRPPPILSPHWAPNGSC